MAFVPGPGPFGGERAGRWRWPKLPLPTGGYWLLRSPPKTWVWSTLGGRLQNSQGAETRSLDSPGGPSRRPGWRSPN